MISILSIHDSCVNNIVMPANRFFTFFSLGVKSLDLVISLMDMA